MENKDISNKIVKIAESIIKQEEARLANRDEISFFDASDELESIEAQLNRLSEDLTDNVEIIDEEDIEEADKDASLDIPKEQSNMGMKDVAASLLNLAKELTEE